MVIPLHSQAPQALTRVPSQLDVDGVVRQAASTKALCDLMTQGGADSAVGVEHTKLNIAAARRKEEGTEQEAGREQEAADAGRCRHSGSRGCITESKRGVCCAVCA